MKEVIKYLDENKAIAPFIGAIVVIFTFIIDRIINHRIRKSQIRRDWYTKFLVERNLNKIDEFYTKICDQYEESSILLRKQRDVFAESQQGKAFQDLKDKFESEVISIMTSSNENLQHPINNCMIALADIFIENLGLKKTSTDDISEVKNKMNKNKSDLMKILFKPLK